MKTGKLDEELRVVRSRILESRDPYLNLDCGGEVNLLNVMSDIAALLDSGYNMGSNPLRHLRWYLSRFEWKSVRPANQTDLNAAILDSDYAWPRRIGSHWGSGIVIARENVAFGRRRICFKIWPAEDVSIESRRSGVRFLEPYNEPGRVNFALAP